MVMIRAASRKRNAPGGVRSGATPEREWLCQGGGQLPECEGWAAIFIAAMRCVACLGTLLATCYHQQPLTCSKSPPWVTKADGTCLSSGVWRMDIAHFIYQIPLLPCNEFEAKRYMKNSGTGLVCAVTLQTDMRNITHHLRKPCQDC